MDMQGSFPDEATEIVGWSGRLTWLPAGVYGPAEAVPGTLLSGNLRDSPAGAGPGLAPSVDAASDAALQQNCGVVSPGA